MRLTILSEGDFHSHATIFYVFTIAYSDTLSIQTQNFALDRFYWIWSLASGSRDVLQVLVYFDYLLLSWILLLEKEGLDLHLNKS